MLHHCVVLLICITLHHYVTLLSCVTLHHCVVLLSCVTLHHYVMLLSCVTLHRCFGALTFIIFRFIPFITSAYRGSVARKNYKAKQGSSEAEDVATIFFLQQVRTTLNSVFLEAEHLGGRSRVVISAKIPCL